MRLDALEAAEAAAAARAQAMAAERAVARARNRGAPVDDDDDDITVMPGSTSHRRPRSARAGVPPSPGYAAAAGQRWSTLANLIASGGGRGLMLPQLFGGLAGLGLGMMSEGFGAALPGADGAGGHHRHRHHHGGSGSGSRGRALLDALSNAQRAGIPAHLLLSDRDFTAEDYEMLCRLDQTVENRKGAKQEELDQLPLEVCDVNTVSVCVVLCKTSWHSCAHARVLLARTSMLFTSTVFGRLLCSCVCAGG